MVKLTFCLRRLPALSADAFHRYWLEQHGPLVRSHAATLRIRRYVQTHAIEHPVNAGLRAARDLGDPYDGIAELWWDSVDDLLAASESPEGREAGLALLEDERRFIDLPRCAMWMNQEHVLIA